MKIILHTILITFLLILLLAGTVFAVIKIYEHNEKFFNKTLVQVKCNYIEGTKLGDKVMRKIECEW